jgi:hypothetical protein
LAKAKLRQEYQALKTVSGIGVTLALTIALETGEVGCPLCICGRLCLIRAYGE